MRRKWPRRRPNDDPFGRVQVLIPDHTEIKPRTGVQHQDERPSDARPIAELDTQSDALEHERERADRAEMTADLERERADQAEILRQQATQRAEAADADRRAADIRVAEAEADRRVAEARADDERARSDALRERLEAMQAQLAMAEAEAKAAHDRAGMSGEQQAAAERRAAADRERADRTEASAAHERQNFLDVEVLTRRELDTLREQLAEAEKGREVAEAAVLQAARTADEALQDNSRRPAATGPRGAAQGRMARRLDGTGTRYFEEAALPRQRAIEAIGVELRDEAASGRALTGTVWKARARGRGWLQAGGLFRRMLGCRQRQAPS
jgi:hypothetical protein